MRFAPSVRASQWLESLTAGYGMNSQLMDVVERLRQAHESLDFRSYDYYDWWSTSWGGRLKQWAYRTEPLGTGIFAGPLLGLELWVPFLRRPMGIPRRFYPIAVAQHGLACLELFAHRSEDGLMERALADAERLVKTAIPDARGLCWGFPFNWSTNVGVIPAHQPAATQTAYAFDLFDQLFQLTRDDKHLQRLLDVADTMESEYLSLPRRRGVANSYHGRGYGDVVMNAITYRLHMLVRAMSYGRSSFRQLALDLLEYVLDQQNPDGSWYYGESPKNRFIDHFHTCFVLKNLYRVNQSLQSPELADAVARGAIYYWCNLFGRDGLPRPFARTVRMNIVRHMAYDWAECLGLFPLFAATHGFTRLRLARILPAFMTIFLNRSALIRSHVYRLPSVPTGPYLRWGASPTLLALSKLLNLEVTES